MHQQFDLVGAKMQSFSVNPWTEVANQAAMLSVTCAGCFAPE
jgi:hypothetical protein